MASSAMTRRLHAPQNMRGVLARSMSAKAAPLLSDHAHPKESIMNFSDFQKAYASKSLVELLRAYTVLKVCTIPIIVKYGGDLLQVARDRVGDTLVLPVVKQTFFAHFCAGESQEGIKPTVHKLRAQGIGSILDYASEADVPEEDQRDLQVHPDQLQARTYDYTGEEACDENMRITLRSIAAAADVEGDFGFAAVKVTSLGPPELLRHVSQVCVDIAGTFRKYAAVEAPPVMGSALRDVGPMHTAVLTREAFLKAMAASDVPIGQKEAAEIFAEIDVDNNGRIDYLEWLDYINPRVLGTVDAAKTGTPILPPGAPTELEPEMKRRFASMLERAETLAAAADEAGVTIMFDAEQTYMQPAIDHIVWFLQRKYNTKRPVVYNTYQAYLKDCTDRLELALSKADRHGYKFGCKLVRGAYQVQERLRAAEMGYIDPIQPNLQATHDSYNASVARIMDSIANGSGAQLMIASHNEDSILKAAALMHQKGIAPEDRSVFFGQLLGMCDHASLTLGNAGYAVYKYVPYGPVGEVIPYLVRRAQENGDLMAGSARERELMKQAMLARTVMSPWAFPALYTAAAALAFLA